MRDVGNIDHKSSHSRLQLVQHVFVQAEKRRIEDHSPGDLDPNDVVSDFGIDFHAFRLSQSAFHSLRCEGYLAQPHTSGIEDSVTNGRRDRNGGQLSRARGLDGGLIDQGGLNFGHVRKRQNGV